MKNKNFVSGFDFVSKSFLLILGCLSACQSGLSSNMMEMENNEQMGSSHKEQSEMFLEVVVNESKFKFYQTIFGNPCAVLLGKSGSGKTSLFNALCNTDRQNNIFSSNVLSSEVRYGKNIFKLIDTPSIDNRDPDSFKPTLEKIIRQNKNCVLFLLIPFLSDCYEVLKDYNNLISNIKMYDNRSVIMISHFDKILGDKGDVKNRISKIFDTNGIKSNIVFYSNKYASESIDYSAELSDSIYVCMELTDNEQKFNHRERDSYDLLNEKDPEKIRQITLEIQRIDLDKIKEDIRQAEYDYSKSFADCKKALSDLTSLIDKNKEREEEKKTKLAEIKSPETKIKLVESMKNGELSSYISDLCDIMDFDKDKFEHESICAEAINNLEEDDLVEDPDAFNRILNFIKELREKKLEEEKPNKEIQILKEEIEKNLQDVEEFLKESN